MTDNTPASGGLRTVPVPSTTRNLTGFFFDHWYVVAYYGKKSGRGHWHCRCSCGQMGLISHYALVNKISRSCGKSAGCQMKLSSDDLKPFGWRKASMVGKKYGSLDVLKFQGRYQNHHYWQCQCRCGALVSFSTDALVRQGKTHCGCLDGRPGPVGDAQPSETAATETLMRVWMSMRRRDRGQVCEAWNSFEVFASEVGFQPSDKHRLMRIDHLKPWSAQNAVWSVRDMDSSE